MSQVTVTALEQSDRATRRGARRPHRRAAGRRRAARGRHADLPRAVRPGHARLGRSQPAGGLHGPRGLRARGRGDAPRERPPVGAAGLPCRRQGARGRPRGARRRTGRLVAVLEVEETYEYDKEREAEQCFRTTDDAHPGVARLYAQKPLYLAGRVTVFERAEPPFPELALDPAETRAEFAKRGWKRIVGFQTRNPIHRAHEYLTKTALETVDGLLIHPLVGDTKQDDVPAKTRVDCYRVLVDNYYPADRVVVSAFPAAMRYAGPSGGDLARDLPQELRLLALHRRPRPRRRRRLLRLVRRAADLRRVRAARARHRADVLRARRLLQALRGDGLAEDLPARRRRPRLPVGDEGPGDARRTERFRPSSSRGPRSQRC